MEGLLERGGGLNSKSRLCESSAILISNRAQIPGVLFRLSGNIKRFIVCYSKKVEDNALFCWVFGFFTSSCVMKIKSMQAVSAQLP